MMEMTKMNNVAICNVSEKPRQICKPDSKSRTHKTTGCREVKDEIKKCQPVSQPRPCRSVCSGKSEPEEYHGRSNCGSPCSTKSHKSVRQIQVKTARNNTEPLNAHCFDQPMKFKHEPCCLEFDWQRNKYVRDECGSGIIPVVVDKSCRNMYCKTPLSMYQATIGELGRKVLCGESRIVKDVMPAPPCTVCEYVLPPCRGYYRKYDCLRPCEEDFVRCTGGQKIYRNPVERYWTPCPTDDEKSNTIRKYAAHNAYLGERIRRKFDYYAPCW